MNLKRGKPKIKDGIYRFGMTTFADMIVSVVNLTAITGNTSTTSRRSLSNGTFGLETNRKLPFLLFLNL